MERIKKIIKKINVFLSGIFIFTSLLAAYSFITIISVIFLNNKIGIENLFVKAMNQLKLDFVTFELLNDIQIIDATTKNLNILYYVLLFIGTLLSLYVIYFCKKIFKTALNESPFTDKVAQQIEKFSYLIFMFGVLRNLVSYASYQFFMHSFDLTTLFLNENVVDVNIMFTFDLSFVMVFVIVYLLSLIFRYGVELQKLSDETL